MHYYINTLPFILVYFLLGVDTVRAFKMQDEFIMESDRRIDSNNMAYYPSIMANRLPGLLSITNN